MATKDVINSSHPLHPVGHALAAAGELLEAIYRLRPDDAHGKTYGTQEVAVSAWFARGCLLALNPATLDQQSARTALFRLRDAVEKATRGSCLRWKAEGIEDALESLRAFAPSPLVHESDSAVTTNHQIVDMIEPKLPRRIEVAYRAYKAAEGEFDHPPTDREAYDWVKENGPENLELPDFKAWSRYVREGRNHYGEQKNTPRTGRTGRSIVSPNDLDVGSDE